MSNLLCRSLILVAALAVADCKQAREKAPASALPELPPAAEPIAEPTAEPMFSPVARKPVISPQPFCEYRKYSGTIDGESITMDLTLKDPGSGLHGFGRYYYGREGLGRSVHAAFHDTDRFEFQLWDSSGNHIVETLTGRFSSLDAFAGDWTRFQPDSIQDPEYGFWKKTRIRREQGSFRLTRTMAGLIPVRIQVHRLVNDSGSQARIRENRIEDRLDSLPSRLDMTFLRVHSGRDSVDSVLNLGIDRILKDFCLSQEGVSMPPETPLPPFADSLFAREWASSGGRFFSTDYETIVMANANGVLSLRYSWSAYAGGAHGSDDHVYASFDAATGRRLELGDLLVPDYQDRLGALAGEPSCDADPERDYPCVIEGLVEKGFALLPDGIRFHATIGTSARDVFVSHADLAPLAKPGGILERFLVRPKLSD